MKNGKVMAGSIRMMWRYKLRTFLMSIGVVVGVAVLVVIRSYGAGMEANIMNKMKQFFDATNIMVTTGFSADGPRTTLKLEDLEAVQAACPEIEAWDPSLMRRKTAQYRSEYHPVLVRGHSEHAELVWERGVTGGRSLDASDVKASARVALLGYKTADILFGDDDPLDQSIQLDGVPYRVIGILEPKGSDPHGEDRDDEIHVPISTMMRRIANVDYINFAKLRVTEAKYVEDVAERVEAVLRQQHALADGEDNDFSLFTPMLIKKMVARANKVFSLYLPLVAAIALLVAAIVIANIMLMAVKERIPEIGLRKAVGATDGQVSRQFLMEAFMVTLVSGLAGIVLGLGVLAVISARVDVPMPVSATAVGLGLAAAVVVGILAGIWPSRHAARMDPVAALR
ncbi:MAG: ABC transporter permease [Acidobacteriota bacterium]|nr:ABC transporter permease [Acidobacteriota bacterium]